MSVNYDQATEQKISTLYWNNQLRKIIEKPLDIIKAIVDDIIERCVRIEKAIARAKNKNKKKGTKGKKIILTSREQDCIKQLSLGVYKYEEIAANLKLSKRTVEMYFETIKRKYGKVNKKQLIESIKNNTIKL
jgi:DNA-binding CsgD family transcriptional regulator